MKRAAIYTLPSALTVLLLWLPFGVHMGPILEEWGLLGLYAEHGPIFFAGADSLMPSHQMRPLMTTSWAFAYAMDPNSWWVWHAELALALVVKGVSLAWLMLYLTGSQRWAIVAGLLYLVWPADTLQMSFRALNIVLSSALGALSAALTVAAYVAAGLRWKLILAIAAVVSMVIGSWTYELTLLMAPLPFLAIWAREGLRGTWSVLRRDRVVTFVWLGGALICAAYIVFVLLTAKETYQQAVTGGRQQLFETLKTTAPMLFSRGFVRSLLGGWVDAVRIVGQDLRAPVYLLFVAAVVAAMLYLTGRGEARGASTTKLWRVAVVGALALTLGYAPFLLSHAHAGISQRTFLFAALGSALIFGALLVGLDRLSRIGALSLATVLLVLGISQQLFQFREYSSLYDQQRKLLRAVVEQVRNLPTGKTLVVLDESQQLSNMWMLNGLLPSALTYLLERPIRAAQVCLGPEMIWAQRDTWGSQGTCEEHDDGFEFRSAPILDRKPVPESTHVSVPRAEAFVIRITPEGTAPETPEVQANRRALLRGDDLLSHRYRGILGPNVWPSWLRFLDRPQDMSAHRWDFGRRWNIDQPEPGSGWNEPEWIYRPFRQTSVSWISRPKASLLFRMEPVAQPYEFVMRTLDPWQGDRSMVRLTLNGQVYPINWGSTGNVLSSSVPAGALRDGINSLEIEAPVYPTLGFSLHVDRIDLRPAVD